MLQPARRAAIVVATTLATACLPYTVATTAHTVAPHEVTHTSIAYFIPGGIDVPDSRTAVAMPGIDYEARYGLDERSDVGVRLPSYSGLIATYKRRLSGDADGRTAATAIMVGAGVVNWAEHAHAELTFLASGPESWTGGVTPYGGLRVMQVAPIERGAPHDSPTAGGFFGLRIGDHLHGISPEIGDYHDRSTLGVRRGSIIVVPAVSVYGLGMLGLPGRSASRGSRTGSAPPPLPTPRRRPPFVGPTMAPPAVESPHAGSPITPGPSPLLPSAGRPATDAARPTRPPPTPPHVPSPSGVRTARPA
jgi:hypothetical protein